MNHKVLKCGWLQLGYSKLQWGHQYYANLKVGKRWHIFTFTYEPEDG